MKNRIHKLSKDVYDLIAAGEVVTGPLSVVKELVENSIDAGADSIAVEIAGGGRDLIRVTDNGCGIEKDDLLMAFTAHATSKISSEKDLGQINSLGFRGEALAAIAAVSKVELCSATADSETAYCLKVEGGETSDIEISGAPAGTRITIKDLFFNTPARLKFLKSERSETSKIVAFISKMAVCRADIKFRMTTGKATTKESLLFTTNGNGDVQRAINTVYGPTVGEGLLEIDGMNDSGFEIRAYVTGIGRGAKSRKTQIFFVNGRYVKDDVISSAIAEAYTGYVPEARYPVVFLFLKAPSDVVDVNVHPAKSEIRFFKPESLVSFVINAVQNRLKTLDASPKATSRAELVAARRKEREFYSLGQSAEPVAKKNTTISTTLSADKKQDIYDLSGRDTSSDKNTVAEVVNINTLWSDDKQSTLYKPDNAEAKRISGESSGESEDFQLKTAIGTDSEKAYTSDRQGTSKQLQLDINTLVLIGRLFGSYIIASDTESLYLIDQHAAHERINFEQFLKQLNNENPTKQTLLSPYVYQLSPSVKLFKGEKIEFLNKIGFEAEEFGEASIAVRSYPAFLNPGEAELFVTDIFESDKSLDYSDSAAIDRIIARACRKSIKAGESLSIPEEEALLKSLSGCENPYTCPHGRPVFIRFTKDEIDRLFNR